MEDAESQSKTKKVIEQLQRNNDLRDVTFNTGWKYHTKYDNFDRIDSIYDLMDINYIRMDEYERDVERFGVYCLL